MNIPQDFEPVVEGSGKATKRWYEFFQDLDAYTRYTPTITSSVGTFTTVSAVGHHKKKGRTVLYNVVVTITTVGTAAGAVLVPLPFTPAPHAQVLSGREASNGLALTGYIPSSTAVMQILEYDATTAAASGAILIISGSYESAT